MRNSSSWELWRCRRGDIAAVLGLLLLTAVVEWPLLTGGTMVGVDPATFFYPMYSLLGERLRAGDLPVWNPHQFAGAPFAADPQSGWMYLLAMLLFTFLPLSAAAKSFMFLTLFLSGVSTYALARVLRLSVSGALLAAVSYILSGRLYERNVGCFACAGVAAWLPLLILCTEMAMRGQTWISRSLWWAGAGLALSQILAIWPGQGAYYSLLLLGMYVVYRGLVQPPGRADTLPHRTGMAVLHLLGVGVFGFGLAAAGLLPRLEYNALSSLAGGYEGEQQQAVVGGWHLRDWALMLERTTSSLYIGSATLLLALLAPLVARGRHLTPLWSLVAVGSLVLSLEGPTPLHMLAYLLPAFDRLHPHNPGRILALTYLAIPLLAGATWSALPYRGRWTALLSVGPVLGAVWLRAQDVPLALPVLLVALLAALIIATHALLTRRWPIASALMLSIVVLDLIIAATGMIEHRLADPGAQGFRKVSLDEYYEPTPAARFLQERTRAEPVRYFGYDPQTSRWNILHRARFGDPTAAPLLINNRAMMLGLHDIQGYNPIHLVRYDELITAINGHTQEYRESYIYPLGLGSPFLNLLNTRYVVVPSTTLSEWFEVHALKHTHTVAYSDAQVAVLENPNALPRAWLVHSAQEVRPGEALELLGDGSVSPALTAVLEEEAPPLALPTDARQDEARITLYEPDRIRVHTRSAAPGMLVLSEMHFPTWKAYVDGVPARLLRANHVLQAVALPAGTHTVELRAESLTLRAGLAISLGFALLILALGFACVARHRGLGRAIP